VDSLRNLVAVPNFGAPQGGAGFNPNAAGQKVYGSGQPMPTTGALANVGGYAVRDAKAAARRDALMRRAQGGL
jgi:hypothetical protein